MEGAENAPRGADNAGWTSEPRGYMPAHRLPSPLHTAGSARPPPQAVAAAAVAPATLMSSIVGGAVVGDTNGANRFGVRAQADKRKGRRTAAARAAYLTERGERGVMLKRHLKTLAKQVQILESACVSAKPAPCTVRFTAPVAYSAVTAPRGLSQYSTPAGG